MAWIESHQSLARHPKLLRLAVRVGVGRPQVIGHLHLLWWWAMDYAPDGNLSRFDAQEIAAASEWSGDPHLWLAALTEIGWIDPGGLLHNWSDYAGKLAEQRARDRERKRNERARQKPSGPSPSSEVCPPDVPGTSSGCPPLHNTTQPDRTQENQVEKENTHSPPLLGSQPPPGFPKTEAEAVASGTSLGAPADFVTKLWHLAASRGWRDARNIQLRNWPSYLAASLAIARESRGSTTTTASGDRREPLHRKSRELPEDIRAPIL